MHLMKCKILQQKKKDESEKINIDTDTIQKEKNNNLALISSLISNEDFFGYKVNRKIMKHHDLITKRFDPLLGVGSNFIKKDETQINDKEPEMKISKGFEKISAIKPKFDSNEHLRKKDKDADLSKVINSIQTTELKEVKVEINYNFFKNLTSGEEKVDSKKEIVKEEKSGIVKTIKKLSLEERHAKKEEYKRLKKEKLKKKIEKEKKEQLQDEKYRLKLLKEYGEEKTENYLRMIKLISEKKQNKSKKIKEEE